MSGAEALLVAALLWPLVVALAVFAALGVGELIRRWPVAAAVALTALVIWVPRWAAGS